MSNGNNNGNGGLFGSDGERKLRLFEVLLTVSASVVTSATIISWRVGSTVTRIETQIAEHTNRLEIQGRAIIRMGETDTKQSMDIAVISTQYANILRELEALERNGSVERAEQRKMLETIERKIDRQSP